MQSKLLSAIFFILLNVLPVHANYNYYDLGHVSLLTKFAHILNSVPLPAPRSLLQTSLQSIRHHSTGFVTCIGFGIIGWLCWQQRKLSNRLNILEDTIADLDIKIKVKEITKNDKKRSEIPAPYHDTVASLRKQLLQQKDLLALCFQRIYDHNSCFSAQENRLDQLDKMVRNIKDQENNNTSSS